MIYYVTNNKEIFNNDLYEIISIEKSISLLEPLKVLQIDSETNGRDPHINKILLFQIGSYNKDFQIVIDCTTINIKVYKDILESKLCIGHNLKFDLQFLYNYGIIPLNVYDTMIVEQMLYLGYPNGIIKYSLAEVANRRLKIFIDKTVRGQIIWRGIDSEVIKYAANDVVHLYDIMIEQLKDCKIKKCINAAKVECDAVPSIAYLEWCGITLDEELWKLKMQKDLKLLNSAKVDLDNFIISTSDNITELKKYIYINRQGDLFSGFDLTPKVNINWSSSKQVIEIAKIIGFDTKIVDKVTGEFKDSVIEKKLSKQKGINDKFLSLYFNYQEYAKRVSSFGQGHLYAINPKTGKIHTVYRQLGASSGRLSCGSNSSNEDLAKFKNISSKLVKYPNIQQLPSDTLTRECFIAPKGNLMISCDYSSEESRLAADIYQDEEFIKEFKERSGDTHSMFAWTVFRDECIACGCKGIQDIESKAPQWRKKVKAVEFSYLFGAGPATISENASCTIEEAKKYITLLNNNFKGVSEFAKKGSIFVRKNGYIVINPITGHKLYWWDHKQWLKNQELQISENSNKVASKYDRLARNVVTQGTGAIILKTAMCNLFKWIVRNNLFDKVHICAAVHDELVCDFPEELKEFPNVLETTMEEAAAIYCKSLPIPAKGEVSNHWIH